MNFRFQPLTFRHSTAISISLGITGIPEAFVDLRTTPFVPRGPISLPIKMVVCLLVLEKYSNETPSFKLLNVCRH